MNRFLVPCIAFLFLIGACGQEKPSSNPLEEHEAEINGKIVIPAGKVSPVEDTTPLDISPLDVLYYPVDFPKKKAAGLERGNPVTRILYSRPHLHGRQLVPDIIKYDQPWRIGANESTEIEFFRNVTIMNKTVIAGRYIIYVIPSQNSWQLVLNNNVDTWGLNQDSSQDVARFTINPEIETDYSVEYLSASFKEITGGAELCFYWGEYRIKLPIHF